MYTLTERKVDDVPGALEALFADLGGYDFRLMNGRSISGRGIQGHNSKHALIQRLKAKQVIEGFILEPGEEAEIGGIGLCQQTQRTEQSAQVLSYEMVAERVIFKSAFPKVERHQQKLIGCGGGWMMEGGGPHLVGDIPCEETLQRMVAIIVMIDTWQEGTACSRYPVDFGRVEATARGCTAAVGMGGQMILREPPVILIPIDGEFAAKRTMGE